MIHSRYTYRAGCALIFLPLMLSAQRAPNNVPLKNWATPLYWQPNQSEREVSTKAGPQLQFSANAVSTNALTFIAITPCRLVDTRGAAAGFNGISPFSGPAIASMSTITIPVQSAAEVAANTTPAPCGTIPPFAQAYSLNLTVVPHAPGAVDFVTMWPAGGAKPFVATLNDPQGAIAANAAIVPAGTPTGGISIFNDGPSTTDVVVDMNGYFAAPTDAVGDNTAVGFSSLASNTSGGANTALGFNALQSNTTGGANTANGFDTLVANTTGASNTASGADALEENTTGGANTAYGTGALQFNTSGIQNTAIGAQALLNNITGNNDIAIGFSAGTSVATGNSNNIHIGHIGVSGDSGVIRIGTPATQTKLFAAGIRGVTTGNNDAVAVVIDSTGQLGTVSSSERFKEDIHDMGDASSGLLRLRPVTFRYKQPFADGSKPIEYGLIAEEVAGVYPDLVAHSSDGQIETVKYQVLDSMLLNEVQKQAGQLREQAEQNRQESEKNRQQAEQIRLLEDRLAALEQSLAPASEPAR